MAPELATVAVRLRKLRFDPTRAARGSDLGVLGAVLALLAGVFVLIGAGNRDLGPIESKLGLAAGAGLQPLGQVYGGWEPGLWPLPVALSSAWAWAEGGWPTSAAVRWPAALAGVASGLILARSMARALGPRAGVWMGLCWYGTLALIDRSAGTGIDWMVALGLIGALDRALTHSLDWVAGFWAAWAFLAGGWPPLVVVGLALVILGRHGMGRGWGLIGPPVVAVVAWSAWALAVAPAEAWAAAWTLPLTQKPDWLLPLGVVALGLPWSPLALAAAWRSTREGWPAPGRAWVLGWFQGAVVALIVGMVLPGLAASARGPALAGLAVVAAAVCERVWAGSAPKAARRVALGVGLAVAWTWAALNVVQGGYLIAAVAYYRPIAVVLLVTSLAVGLVALGAAGRGEGRWALWAVLVVAFSVKAAHWGVYVPEWNYRFSQGPWGRAIGQWVPHGWTIYTTLGWRHDLAFATGRPVQHIADARLLNYKDRAHPLFVLLSAPEFDHWPADAPKLIKVRTLQNEHGATRVLARTEGPLVPARTRDAE
jgi:hypothetical protein